MQCNIDARGKRIRLLGGIVCLAVGLALIALAFAHVAPFWALAGPGLGCAAGGAFQVFEARAGWCALRAMGIKTRF